MRHVKINIILKFESQRDAFRHIAKELADKLEIVGYIKNEEDKSMIIEAEGKGLALVQFVDWCKEGPQETHVDCIEIENAQEKHYNCFQLL